MDHKAYREKLHALIPGGAHTYSRGDDQYPENAPAIVERGEGCYLFTPEGERFLDYGMGLRSVNIGYAHNEIAAAAYEEALKGNNLSRASVTELNAAQLLVDLIPSVEMVKFAKHGSTVTTAALKLARAYTGRKYIAVPVEHPFFSFDDWFIGSTPLQRGVPSEHSSLTLRFNYNNIESLQKLFDEYPSQIAAVLLEPATTISPCVGCRNCQTMPCHECPNNGTNFLHQVKNLCTKNSSLFILDEMITGFRWHLQGAQTYYNIEPDLCTFGKGMANGFAVAAVAGKREIMNIAGIQKEGAERVFLTSTTHGAEMSALGAFIKTIEVIKRDHVIEHFWEYGKKLRDGMNAIAKEIGIEDQFYTEGYPCSLNYVTKDKDGTISLAFRTLFSQEMIRQHVMMPWIALCFSHQDKELAITLNAVRNSLMVYKNALNDGIEKYLHSKVIKPVFRKYN